MASASLDPLFLALLFMKQHKYEKCVDVCTELLDKNPYDEAVWSLKTRALTAQVRKTGFFRVSISFSFRDENRFLDKMRAQHEDYVSKLATNAENTCLAGFGLCVGGLMILLGALLGDQCKIQAIDSSTMNDPDAKGNLPKWFIYTGTIFVMGSSLACGVIGIIPLCLRSVSKSFGGKGELGMSLLTFFWQINFSTFANVGGNFQLKLMYLNQIPFLNDYQVIKDLY